MILFKCIIAGDLAEFYLVHYLMKVEESLNASNKKPFEKSPGCSTT